MIQTTMQNPSTVFSRIAGLGSAFPKRVITNEEIADKLGGSLDWIEEATGIKEHRTHSRGECLSDIATEAALKALAKAQVDISDVDTIFACTNSPDRWIPGLAVTAQKKIKAKTGVVAFDVVASCAGWLLGIKLVSDLVRFGTSKNCLVIGADAMSDALDFTDRNSVLFGDSAGAALVSASADNSGGEILKIIIHADGNHGEILRLPGGGSQYPTTLETVKQGLQFVRLDGENVFFHAIRNMTEACKEVLGSQGLTVDDVDWLVPHQAKKSIIDVIVNKLRLPDHKLATNIRFFGNTTAATIPTYLDAYVNVGKIKMGKLILLTTFGGGLTWSSGLIRL